MFTKKSIILENINPNLTHIKSQFTPLFRNSISFELIEKKESLFSPYPNKQVLPGTGFHLNSAPIKCAHEKKIKWLSSPISAGSSQQLQKVKVI